ncbi:MAG TPA: sensor domain-containing diguanylate cyclase [Chloroflexota bacterium]|nr:sensor domain-containing diguanylate cyclase [Chloroflexota bacterium]
MPPHEPTTVDQQALSATRAPLDVLATLARRMMSNKEAAEVVLSGLESIAALVPYDYALLEVIPGFGQSGAPTIFRATPAAVEAISPAGVLVDENAQLFPLTAGGRELGRLRVIARDGTFAPTEMAALHVLAGYMSLALKLAEVETKARRLPELDAAPRRQGRLEAPGGRRSRVGSLRAELSQILSAQLGLSVLCDRVLERLITVLNVEAGALFIYDEREGELLRATQRGVPGPLPARITIEANAPTLLGRTAAAGTAQLTGDIFAMGLESEEDKVLRTWGFYSVLCYPLLSGKRVVGGMQLMSRRTGAMTNDGLALLDALNDELALALQNAVTFDRLSTMTITDALTGLHNRRFCEEFVRKQLMAAQRSKRGCGCLLIDIDHFQSFNERFGRVAGDAVLRSVASMVLASIRAADLAGRYGGEEFIVVLPNADLNTTVSVADRIRANIRQIPSAAGISVPVTVSIGASCFPECAGTLSQLFNSADLALYAAKEGGRDRVLTASRLPEPAK